MSAIATLRRIATVLVQQHGDEITEHAHPSVRNPAAAPVRPPRADWTPHEWAEDFVVTVRDSGVDTAGLDYSAGSLALVDDYVALFAAHDVDVPAEVAEGAAGYFVQVITRSWRELAASEAASLQASTRSFVLDGGSLDERYSSVVG